MALNRSLIFFCLSAISGLYSLFAVWFFFQNMISTMHMVPYENLNNYGAVTWQPEIHWRNVFSEFALISKVTEISYLAASFILVAIFWNLSLARINKVTLSRLLSYLGFSVTVGAIYKLFAWPILEFYIVKLDKIYFPNWAIDPLLSLLGAGILVCGIHFETLSRELESFV